MSTEKQTVFLSGASGYIAQHIIKDLLANNFKVIGSVRSEDKAQKLANNFNNSPDLSFVYVKDISDPKAFDAAFEEHGSKIDFVIHSASPFRFDINDVNKDLIVPAEIGSSGIFKAAAKYAPNLKHFVVTSSYAAVSDAPTDLNKDLTFTEKTWNEMPFEKAVTNAFDGYYYSKTIAEKTIWRLAKELNVKFGITAVNPSFVFGPQAFDNNVTKVLNTSCQLINAFLDTTPESTVDESIKGAFVDVRDVAKAHVAPLSNSKKFNGERLILSADRFGNQSLVDSLNKIPSLKGKIAVGTPHRDDNIAQSLAKIDNSRTKELLGFKFVSLDETVKDTVEQVLKVNGKL
ncbi:hypothetical protein ACO0R3_003120 [Hanseniaspora guilliermondii]